MQQLLEKPLSYFKLNPQVRKTFNERELRSLGESLLVRQLVPVLARVDGTIDDGERRYRAAELVGKATLLAIVTDEAVSPDDRLEIQLVSALHREGLTPYEEYLGCTEWLSHRPGATLKQLAERLSCDPSSLTRTIALNKCIKPVHDAAEKNLIGKAAWYEISHHPEAQQAELLRLYLSTGDGKQLTSDQLVSVGRRKRGGNSHTENKPAVIVQRLRCPLPSGLTVQFSGKAVSLQAALDAMKDLTAELKTAMSQGLDARTVVRVLADKSKSAAK
jgi:ParB/RepB/Spo0J family partition protein